MILILGAAVSCDSMALFSVSSESRESLHEEAHLDEASEHKSPWQQRWPCKHMTLSPRVLKASALYYKSKKLQHAQLQESLVEKI